MNNRHPNIKFTKENNVNGSLPFLDILIANAKTLSTTVYRKSTYTGLLLNFKSFAPFQYKTRLIQTLLDRTFKICSNWLNFDVEVKKLSKTLVRNMYPKKLIDKCLRMYLDKKLGTSEKDTHHDKKEMKYITLPYIGYFSKCTKKKINRLVKQFCQNSLNIQLIFTT